MDKTKLFIEQNSKWQILEACVSRIEAYKETSAGLAIENCKSIIDSILKTIIVDTGVMTAEDLKEVSTTLLYRKAREILFVDKEGYQNIIGSFAAAITEYRNKLGETSHGKDIYTLESNQGKMLNDELEFVISTTDNSAFFLLNYYTNLYPTKAVKKQVLNYVDNGEFNKWLDENEDPVMVAGMTLLPSKVLFDVDVEAYKSVLDEYKEKENLIESLKVCPNFASTHLVIKNLLRIDDFSPEQVRRLFDVFFANNQVSWIATDDDVANFYKPLFEEYSGLLTSDELVQFNEYYTKTT